MEDIINNQNVLNPVLSVFMKELNVKLPKFKESYDLFINTMVQNYKSIGDYDKFKVLMKDPGWMDENYKAVYYVNHDKIERSKMADIPVKKGKKKEKVVFEPDYYEKFPNLQTANEKMKIIAFNDSFERVMRYNIIECINKIIKLDAEKENILNELREFCDNVYPELYPKVAESLNIDLFEFKCDEVPDYMQEPDDNPNTDPMDNMG